MSITIGGMAGTGTSTVAKAIGEKYGFIVGSSGALCRQIASEKGVHLLQLEQDETLNTGLDKLIDEQTVAFAEKHPRFVFEGRLAHFFIKKPDVLHVLLICSDDIRWQRIARREGTSFESARDHTIEREAAFTARIQRVYPPHLHHHFEPHDFDVVLDTSTTTPEEIATHIVELHNNVVGSIPANT